MDNFVEIFEVGPRDGLQNQPHVISTADKIKLVNLLSECGFRRIEVASFVSPKRVPQMADSGAVLAGISRVRGVSYAALTPNSRGLAQALAAGADEVAIFGSASEGFSQANINCSISESFRRFRPIITTAIAATVRVRGYVSCVTDCPYDGPTPPEQVARVARELLDMGCYEVSLGDTLGQATPATIGAMLAAVLSHIPAHKLAGHFHDTAGRALDNIQASLLLGLRVYDASVGGLGGCPFAPGSAGNVATEALDARLTQLGYQTGLRPDILARAADMAKSLGQG